jgi:hypothetical protein
VLKLIPAGAAGEIAKLAITPPVEVIVKPVAAVLTVTSSVDEERVKAGAEGEGAAEDEGVGLGSGSGGGGGGGVAVVMEFEAFDAIEEPAIFLALSEILRVVE